MLFRIVIRKDPDQTPSSKSQTGKAMIICRLLLQKQPGLGLNCVFRLFWQETKFKNFRTFTI